jgi:hypothetical protein
MYLDRHFRLDLDTASRIVDAALGSAQSNELAARTAASLDARGCDFVLTMEDGSGLLRPRPRTGNLGAHSVWTSERANSRRSWSPPGCRARSMSGSEFELASPEGLALRSVGCGVGVPADLPGVQTPRSGV